MKILKKALSLFLTAAVMVSVMCTGAVNAVADAKNDYKITTATTEDGAYCIQVTTSNFFMIDLTAERLTDHIITAEYFCENNTYKFTLDYIGRFPYPVFHINEELSNNTDIFDYKWDTTWVNDQAIYSDIFLYAKSDEHISELKTCSQIRITCSGKLNSRIVLVNELIPVNHTTDDSNTGSQKDNTEADSTEIKDISSLDISTPSNYAYTGKNRKALIVVSDGSKTLEKGTDYTLSYKNCKEIGTASVTIKGKGDYTGTKTLTYKIVPKKTTLKAAKKSDSKVKLSWTAAKGAEKYQIYYSTDGKTYKKLATASGSKTSVTLSGLDFKKYDYKFKIRSYGTNDSKKYYSSFSKVVTVK